MSTNPAYDKFFATTPGLKILTDHPLARYTTFGIGGPADLFALVDQQQQLVAAVRNAKKCGILYRILGGGSNVLISDAGFRGVVFLNKTCGIDFNVKPEHAQLPDRACTEKLKALYRKFCSENPGAHRLVAADTGVALQKLIKLALRQDLRGLEVLAGIPGTVGGALYNNAHYAGHEIAECIVAVEYLDSDLKLQLGSPGDLHFGYDKSDFRKHRDWVATRVFFALWHGDGKMGWALYRNLLSHRDRYSGRSAGCIFVNLSKYQMKKARLPSRSIGYINDKILRINGLSHGGAVLGKQHGNFITNENKATASDVMYLIDFVKQKYLQEFGIRLRLEIDIIA